MTRRINQKLAHKRKLNDQHTVEKEAKKARKVESITTTSCLVVEQLVGGPVLALTALSNLARCAGAGGEDEPPDQMDEFFAGGGQASHILHMLDTNQEKNKANDVAAVFNTVEAVITRVVRGKVKLGDRSMDVATELVKRVNSDYSKEIVLLISGTNTAYQAKSVLRMLTAMVTLGPAQAREVLLKVNWEHDNWDTLCKRSSKKDPPDVRTCFIHFLLAFLFEPSALVLKDFFNIKNRLASLFPGLMHDTAETVMLVLETLKSKVLENPAVNKTQKMKVLGSHNIKPLLSLLKWSGPKKDDHEHNVEEKEAVEESLTSFLKVLLGSCKHGVVFADPMVGQGEKTLNPLAKEVLVSMPKPWESVSLSSIIVELVSACPDQMGSLLRVLEDNWVPRDSPSWHQVMDLILTTLERMDCKAMAKGMMAEFPVVKVVENVIIPSKLVEKVIKVGLSMEYVVSMKCLEVLVVLVNNSEMFLNSLSSNTISVATAAVKTVMEKHLSMVTLWDSLVGYITKGQGKQVINILTVLNFGVGKLGLVTDLNLGQILKEIEENKKHLGEEFKDIQLQALKLFSMITTASLSNSSFVDLLCSKDTFLMLLENMVISDGQEKVSSTGILSGLVRSSGVSLPSSLDLDLLVALVEKENISVLADILIEARDGKKQLEEQLEEQCLALKSEEVSLRNQNQQSQAELFDALMSPDFTPSMISSFCPPKSMEDTCSPLTLSVLANYKNNVVLVESFFKKIVFLFQDVDVYCKQLSNLTDHFSPDFKSFLSSVLSPVTSNPPEMSSFSSSMPWTLAQSSLVQLLHFPSSDPLNLTNLVTTLPTDMQAGLVRIAVQKLSKRNSFNPFKVGENTNMVVTVLRLAHKLSIHTPDIQEQFYSATLGYLEKNSSHHPDLSLLLESFTLLPLSSNSLRMLSTCLSSLPVNKFCSPEDNSSLILSMILVGVFKSLSMLSQSELMDSIMVSVVAKLTCLVEVLLDTQSELEELTQHLVQLVTVSAPICSALSSNMVVVLVKSCKPGCLHLAQSLVKLDKKHLDAFKLWVCQEKHLVSEKLWPLVKVVLQSEDFESEKKFITIVLKRVVNQVEDILCGNVEHDEELLQLVGLLSKYSKSEKQVELWKKASGERVDSIEECLKVSADIVLLKVKMLVTVHKISGGSDGRLMKECFLPLLHHIGNNIKVGVSMEARVINLCKAARECKELVDNKIFAKEIGKNTTVWQKFFRNILKYSLKVGACGVPALDLLSSICEFLMKGDKLPEAENIVEMVTNHSLYLGTLMGPGCPTKTALLQLLLSLCPASCATEQVPLLLSGYNATLHPSDRAILAMLSMHEKADLDLAQFQPLVFGPSAAQHYAVMAGGAWKQPKVSELLGKLDKDIMRKSCVSFPLSLSLDPHAECEECQDVQVYDPRFILPFLSQLLSPDMYMDKHMRLVDSGALSYAISSLSSREWFVRAAGYHLLARMVTAMDTAKLAQEKQVWLHVLYLIKNGLASGSNISRCARLSSLVTVFLVRVVDILLTPLSPLYRTVSRSILAKPALDLQAVPEFSRLLNSSDLNSTAEQRWILEVVRDGVRDNLDYSLVSRSFVCKILQSQWGSVVTDRVGHLQTLDVVERCVSTNYGCTDLVTRHGLLTWLRGIIRHTKVDKLFVKKVVNIMKIVMENIARIEQRKQVEKKGMLAKLIHTDLVILLDRVKNFVEPEQVEDLMRRITNMSTNSEIPSAVSVSQ